MGSVSTDDGARLCWHCEGDDGPPVLLVQGTGIAGRAWSPQVTSLRERFRVVTFDNRGLGQSTLGTDPLTVERMCSCIHACGMQRVRLGGARMRCGPRRSRARGSLPGGLTV